MVAEDDIDRESLQAQIDMSMSFAHDLVTSWIKPVHLAQLGSSGIDATQIIEEELHRPPRLGVGALIPTGPAQAHEASKLKRRLGGSGTKNESVVDSQPQDPSKSDDEEYKGRLTKRKTKTDPFGSSKKKRKAESRANLDSSVGNVSKHSVSLLNKLVLEHNPSSGNEGRPRDQLEFHVTKDQLPVALVSLPPMKLPVQTTFSPRLTATTVASLSELPRETSAPVPGTQTTLESNRVHTKSMTIPDGAKPLGIPLLNLDGPPELTGKAGNTCELDSPRKKRKRRKKKRKQVIAGMGEN